MKRFTEELVVHDGTLIIQADSVKPGEATVEEVAKRFRFHLCRKQILLGDVPIDHCWMEINSVYGQRNRIAANQDALIEFWWALCWKHATVLHAEIQESYILAHLLPYARGNGSRRVLSEIGRRAGVVVKKSAGKFASAHDLRRSFGTRWAPRVKPATLQLLMRHRSIETTLKYYVAQDADEIADELWKGFSAETGETANMDFEPPAEE